MSGHVHRWEPIPMLFARYECSCSATGYMSYGCEIVEHKTPIEPRRELTVRPYLGYDGMIPPKPTSRG